MKKHPDHITDKFVTDRRSILFGLSAVAIAPRLAWASSKNIKLKSGLMQTPRHKTHYVECGPVDGPLMLFLHGFPCINLIWRAQMEAFAEKGWHCVAPDMRGYGGSSTPVEKSSYTMRDIVADMVELHDHFGGQPAVWVGHDWGSIVTGALVSHEPQRCRGVVLVSWAYFPEANSLETLVSLVDRTIYPAEEYPDGQWDYARYYNTHFEDAVSDLDADRKAYLASAYRPGDADRIKEVSPMAKVTQNGGRFGSAHRAPPSKPDFDLWPSEDFDALVSAFDNNGFHGPCAWYTNDEANVAYAKEALNSGNVSVPVLFINGDYDQICNISGNRQGDPMRSACSNLTVVSMPAGHWIPLEKKQQLSAEVNEWIRANNL